MERWHASAVALLVALAASPARAQTLCGPPNPPIADDEPRVREKDFSATSFAQASQYLRQDVPKLMERLKTEDLLNTEAMYGYTNSLIHVDGYVLLQEALLRRAERDLMTEKSRAGRATRADVTAATARFEEAKQRFCKFLATTHYVD
jgi:hypothetical protein